MGGIIGASVSGTFLWIIGILNLLVLLDILKIWHTAKSSLFASCRNAGSRIVASKASRKACSLMVV